MMIEVVKNAGYFATVTAITEKNAVCDYWQSGMEEAEESYTEEAEAESLARLQPAFMARCNGYDGRHIHDGDMGAGGADWEFVVRAAQWGNWPLLQSLSAAGLRFDKVHRASESGHLENLLGAAVYGYCMAVGVAGRSDALRDQYVQTCVALLNGGAGGTVLCMVPMPGARDLLEPIHALTDWFVRGLD